MYIKDIHKAQVFTLLFKHSLEQTNVLENILLKNICYFG